MLPSNMEIEVVVNGYNNLIQIATEDMQLGFNASVNVDESGSIISEVSKDFETPSKPADQQSDQMRPDLVNQPNPEAIKLNQLNTQRTSEATKPSEATEPDQMLLNMEQLVN